MMRFKYEKQIVNLPECPPEKYRGEQLPAFRFVFANITHKDNFLPVLLKNPRRRLSGNAKCQGYGLSFFDSLENAQTRYLKLRKNYRNIHKGIGTHIANGMIEENDGVVSEIDERGHFTLHEFEQIDLKSKFSLTMKVYDGTN